jgi:hypothetical protein
MDRRGRNYETPMLDREFIEEDLSNMELEIDNWRQHVQEDERRERDS